ncbi:hypothetical protein HCN44_005588 [Aphidius gifuensis]|uniref:Uncharacterized protein n=1 Tax=Aphidius gifuensis TaxID=684658 RepID=A0A834Y3F8_APHGI|nr:hypothetical protein HCN44_005588 [Aphidius gifuensis]
MYDELSENYLQVFCANSLDLENSCIIVQKFESFKGTVKTEGILEARLMLKIERHPSFDWASSVISFDPAWEKEHNDLGCLKIYHPMNKDKRVVIRTSCNGFLFAPFKIPNNEVGIILKGSHAAQNNFNNIEEFQPVQAVSIDTIKPKNCYNKNWIKALHTAVEVAKSECLG